MSAPAPQESYDLYTPLRYLHGQWQTFNWFGTSDAPSANHAEDALASENGDGLDRDCSSRSTSDAASTDSRSHSDWASMASSQRHALPYSRGAISASRTLYRLCCPPPAKQHRLRTGRRLLVQLRRTSRDRTAAPALELYAMGTSAAVRQRVRSRGSGSQRASMAWAEDMIVVRSDHETGSVGDRESLSLSSDLLEHASTSGIERPGVVAHLASISPEARDSSPARKPASASPAPAALRIGSELWQAKALSRGGFEISLHVSDQDTIRLRWVPIRRHASQDSSTPKANSQYDRQQQSGGQTKRFKFVWMTPGRRQHPVCAYLDCQSIDILDAFLMPEPSTPDSPPSPHSDVPDSPETTALSSSGVSDSSDERNASIRSNCIHPSPSDEPDSPDSAVSPTSICPPRQPSGATTASSSTPSIACTSVTPSQSCSLSQSYTHSHGYAYNSWQGYSQSRQASRSGITYSAAFRPSPAAGSAVVTTDLHRTVCLVTGLWVGAQQGWFGDIPTASSLAAPLSAALAAAPLSAAFAAPMSSAALAFPLSHHQSTPYSPYQASNLPYSPYHSSHLPSGPPWAESGSAISSSHFRGRSTPSLEMRSHAGQAKSQRAASDLSSLPSAEADRSGDWRTLDDSATPRSRTFPFLSPAWSKLAPRTPSRPRVQALFARNSSPDRRETAAMPLDGDETDVGAAFADRRGESVGRAESRLRQSSAERPLPASATQCAACKQDLPQNIQQPGDAVHSAQQNLPSSSAAASSRTSRPGRLHRLSSAAGLGIVVPSPSAFAEGSAATPVTVVIDHLGSQKSLPDTQVAEAAHGVSDVSQRKSSNQTSWFDRGLSLSLTGGLWSFGGRTQRSDSYGHGRRSSQHRTSDARRSSQQLSSATRRSSSLHQSSPASPAWSCEASTQQGSQKPSQQRSRPAFPRRASTLSPDATLTSTPIMSSTGTTPVMSPSASSPMVSPNSSTSMTSPTSSGPIVSPTTTSLASPTMSPNLPTPVERKRQTGNRKSVLTKVRTRHSDRSSSSTVPVSGKATATWTNVAEQDSARRGSSGALKRRWTRLVRRVSSSKAS